MEQFKFLGKKKRKFWFEHNQDAPGYGYGDNRILNTTNLPPESRREAVRRTWNF